MLPATIPFHLPLGIVGEGDRFPLAIAQGSGMRATHGPQLLLVESLELVESAFEEHLFRASRESGAVAVVHCNGSDDDLVDRVHPFGSVPCAVEDPVGYPDLRMGVGSTRIRVIVVPDEGDLLARLHQSADPPIFEDFSFRGHGQMTCSLADVAHDATIVAVDGEHIPLFFFDIRDRADDEVGNLHNSSKQSPDNLVKVVISISSF